MRRGTKIGLTVLLTWELLWVFTLPLWLIIWQVPFLVVVGWIASGFTFVPAMIVVLVFRNTRRVIRETP